MGGQGGDRTLYPRRQNLVGLGIVVGIGPLGAIVLDGDLEANQVSDLGQLNAHMACSHNQQGGGRLEGFDKGRCRIDWVRIVCQVGIARSIQGRDERHRLPLIQPFQNGLHEGFCGFALPALQPYPHVAAADPLGWPLGCPRQVNLDKLFCPSF